MLNKDGQPIHMDAGTCQEILHLRNIQGMVDHTADHIMQFGCYPGEHESVSGLVLDTDGLIRNLTKHAPAFARMCTHYLETR